MANLKGGNAIVRFLLAHGEKIGIAAVGLCAGMLLWSALKHDHLQPDQQPERLVELANQASRHVDEFTWESLDPNSKLVAERVSGEAMAPIASENFPPIKEPWSRPVLDPVSLRTDPALLAAEDLEVYGDSGMWASAEPETIKQKTLEAMKERERLQREEAATQQRQEAEGERNRRGGREGRSGSEGRGGGRGLFGEGRGGREGDVAPARNTGPVVIEAGGRAGLQGFETISAKSWVTVVAKVPVKKQFRLYDESLMNASGYTPEQDVPIYRGYIVERAEVTDEGQGDWERVVLNNDLTLEKETSFYPFEPEELVSDRFVHPLLTHPLPPLILREWDRRVTQSSIPLANEDLTEETTEPEAIEEDKKPVEGDDLFATGPRSRDDQPGGERVERRPRPGRRGVSRQPMVTRGDSDSERGAGGRGVNQSRRGSGLFSWDGLTPFVLFRYFDDSVKPGHRYRYRVRLAMADVNHEVPEQFLDKTVTERRGKIDKESLKAYRLTEWSEPSPVASVPLPARVYLVNAEAPNAANYNAEPEARILVQAFNSELPAEIALEENFMRGNVLNVHNKAGVLWVSKSDLKPEEVDREFDFRTGITVIDFRGGEKLGGNNRDLTAPASAVLMDPAGRLFLQSELDDSEPVGNYQRALEGGSGGRGGYKGGSRGRDASMSEREGG